LNSSNIIIGAVWAQYGPYHFARLSALRNFAGTERVCGIEIANQTSCYQWQRPSATPMNLTTLCPGNAVEAVPFLKVFHRARTELARLGIKVCLLPSYSPKQSLAVLLAAKSLGIRTVLMNESHGGTARSAAGARWAKRRLTGLFHAALVGGGPQRRYCASLGMPPEKIFTGYDAVDNDFFAERAETIRADAVRHRNDFQLPARYFLSLGRFVAKKNLAVLIRAFHRLLESNPGETRHLVFVGSGEEDAKLRRVCAELNLPVHDKCELGNKNSGAQNSEKNSDGGKPAVHFYGFRQIEDNPIFYALADAFILPSWYEEWGLVVNEAMASGLPVIVSETAGCAEDLLERGLPTGCDLPGMLLQLRQAGMRRKIRRNGFVFDPNSIAELHGALQLLSSFPQMRAAMEQSSRLIVNKFSCDNFGRQALLAVRAAMGENVFSEDLQTDNSLASASN
jgi:1,2-diacylglycerol 3-alpha-glucosyltransferase